MYMYVIVGKGLETWIGICKCRLNNVLLIDADQGFDP